MYTEQTDNDSNWEHILGLALQLPDSDKARLIAHLATALENSFDRTPPTPRTSLRGLWRDLGITEQDIAQARHETWGDLPREDI